MRVVGDTDPYGKRIALAGKSVKVGQISETGFTYDPTYLSRSSVKSISVSLPLQEAPFSPRRTKNFFDGNGLVIEHRQCCTDFVHTDSLFFALRKQLSFLFPFWNANTYFVTLSDTVQGTSLHGVF